MQHGAAAEGDETAELPVDEQHDEARGQLADHKAIDKIGDGKVAVAALQPVDPIVHGQSPPVS